MRQLFIIVSISLCLWLPHAQAEIPFTQARGVYEGTKDQYKPISPFWGIVAINGMLEQIRFFGNYEKKGGVDHGRVDHGRDDIARLILMLFPSPDGVQFVANTRKGDPVGWLSRNLDKINDVIGILLDQTLQKKR